MKLILNENMPATVVRTLRDRGHDVLAVKEMLRGAEDPTILARAQAENRIVVTQDKDFGELAFRRGLSSIPIDQSPRSNAGEKAIDGVAWYPRETGIAIASRLADLLFCEH